MYSYMNCAMFTSPILFDEAKSDQGVWQALSTNLLAAVFDSKLSEVEYAGTF